MMLTIRRSDVPRYLHKSEFYKSLNDDDDDQISVPVDSFKFNDAVQDEQDLRNLLSTLRFWVAEQIPDGLIYFALHGLKDVWMLVVPEFIAELGHLNILLELNASTEQAYLSVAAGAGRADILHYLLNNDFKDPDDLAMQSALTYGHLECLQLLHTSGFKFNNNSCALAARAGHLDCLAYAHENGAGWSDYIAIDAARAGHEDCLRYVHEHDCCWPHDRLIQAACLGGSVPCLKYVHNTFPDSRQLSYGDADVQKEVVSSGHLGCLKYMHEAGAPWDEDVATYAAACSQLECLQFVTQNGCIIDDGLIYFATTIETLTYLHSIGCAFNEQEYSHGLALYGVDVLRFAHEHGCPWNERTYLELLDANDVDMECFAYAHEHGCPWSETVAKKAKRLSLSHSKAAVVMEYLHEHGFPGL